MKYIYYIPILTKILKSENGEKPTEVKDNLFGDMSDMSTDDEDENPKGNEELWENLFNLVIFSLPEILILN